METIKSEAPGEDDDPSNAGEETSTLDGETIDSLRAANVRLEAVTERQHAALLKAAIDARATEMESAARKGQVQDLRAANRRLRDQIASHKAAIVALSICMDEPESEDY